MTGRRRIHLSALVGVAVAIVMSGITAQAQPLVTGDLTMYYSFDNFTDVVMDGSGNAFNAKVKDMTRNMLDNGDSLATSGVISNDTSNPRRGTGAVRFTQSAVEGDDPVFLDLDGGVIKATAPTKVPTQAVTMAAWVNLPEINRSIGTTNDFYYWNAPASIVQATSSGSGGPSAFVTHFSLEGDGRIRMTLRGENAQTIVASNSAPFSGHPYLNQPEIDMSGATPEPWPLNEWFHLAITYDKSANAGTGEFAMYYNGEKIRSGPPNGTTGGMPTGAIDIGQWDLRPGTLDFYDGLGIGAVMDTGARRLHGLMDEFYMFTRALTEAEIRTLAMLHPGAPGDYNANGAIDAADYVVWRDNVGTTNTIPNDLTPGMVTEADYEVWRTNFGKPTIGSGAANVAVPEPASVTILLACLATLARRRRR